MTKQPTPQDTPVLPAAPPEAVSYGDCDENGVDLSLLRYLLSLSPLERLRLMERHARDTQMLNEYGRRHREASSGSGR
jgi:hypothetical protein